MWSHQSAPLTKAARMCLVVLLHLFLSARYVAVITGASELAQALWHRCEEQPMRLALVASAMCQQLARRCATHRPWASSELQAAALVYEGWAIDMLNSSITTVEAYAVLGSKSASDSPNPADLPRVPYLLLSLS